MIKDQSANRFSSPKLKAATAPTMLAALNLTLWFGCMCMTRISCAVCIQAYLQCLLEGNTWVILPYMSCGWKNGRRFMIPPLALQ